MIKKLEEQDKFKKEQDELNESYKQSLKNKKAVYEELLPNYTPEEFEHIMNYVYDSKHDFMMVNRRQDYITKNFSKIELQECSDSDSDF